jgi:tetratricopeptide (TPR) repeat protein
MARQGKLDLALDHFKRSLALKPDNPNAHYNIGNIHRLRGELDSAIIRYEAALASSPGWPLAQKELERVLSLKKRD